MQYQKSSSTSEQSAGLSLASAVWALLTAKRSDPLQAASLEGLEVRESTWDEWEQACTVSDDAAPRR